MANKIILPLMLALVIGFAITSAVALTEAASIYDDVSEVVSKRVVALEAPAESTTPAPALVASR